MATQAVKASGRTVACADPKKLRQAIAVGVQVRRLEQRGEEVKDELDRANAKYAQVEQIKRFELLDHDLTEEEGELTPTLKLKRNVVYDRYADVFDKLYG
jgi:long-chain acyl-CoA synthetase